MAVVTELIKLEENGLLSFGNYKLDKKAKVDIFNVNGNVYKLKTFKDVTKLEKNGNLLIETTPGTTIRNYSLNENVVTFDIEGDEDPQITMELEPSTQYKITTNDASLGKFKTTMSGKLIFSAEVSEIAVQVKVEKSND